MFANKTPEGTTIQSGSDSIEKAQRIVLTERSETAIIVLTSTLLERGLKKLAGEKREDCQGRTAGFSSSLLLFDLSRCLISVLSW
jgi:hypothetical protein